MILSAQSIRSYSTLITPFCEKQVIRGRSYGLSHAGYDIRVDKFKHGELEMSSVRMGPGDFFLASSVERIKMPTNMIGFIKDKSSWAREGLCVQNTVLEPGWEGWITLELSFHRNHHSVTIESGDPIAQIIFQWLDKPTENPYTGKYQNQEGRPVEAIAES